MTGAAMVPVVAVQFFASCLVELLRPDVGTAAQRVLRAGGHDPRPVRGATCCGQPAYNAGYAPEARRVARRTLRALGDGDAACVVASGSCATMMSHHWPELFAGTPDAAAARKAAARTIELTAFLTGTPDAAGGDSAAQPAALPRAPTATPAPADTGNQGSAQPAALPRAPTATPAPADTGSQGSAQPAALPRAPTATPAPA
ncbi:MAG: heterodisulfide reductase-related iron-sulfur binding cluster, partial [bacterium]|nr:heterodisulfide reductase-related iron-sulfur binding cluster [bacterium]